MTVCYEELLDECPVRSYFRERAFIVRILFSMNAMRNVLCADRSLGLEEITRHSTCIESARRFGYCDDKLGSGIQLLTFFNRMMRFEISDEACQPLSDFKHCLIHNAQEHGCGEQAMNYVTRALDQWLVNFCERAGITVSATHSARYHGNSLIMLALSALTAHVFLL